MYSRRQVTAANPPKDNLNPLLPHIASIIESVPDATIADIQRQVEADLDKKVSLSTLTRALNDGINLGVFNMKREYKVCREFTTKELKKVKQAKDRFMAVGHLDMSEPSLKKPRKKTLMNYVKSQREQRTKRSMRPRKMKNVWRMGNEFQCGRELHKYLCQRCRQSLERENLQGKGTSDTSMEEGCCEREGTNETSRTTLASVTSEESRKRGEDKPKSKLLVQKNPMETQPPYCDIFT